MAILDYEGFDRETSVSLGQYFTSSTGCAISADNAGVLGYGRYGSGNSFWRALASNRTDAVWINAHLYFTALTGNGCLGFAEGVSGTNSPSLVPTSTGAVKLVMNNFTISGTETAAGVVAINAWYFVQMRMIRHNTTGVCQVWVNGTQVINFSGDTSQTANNYLNTWFAGSTTCRVDNVVVYDELGDEPTTRTPETRVFEDLTTGDGSTIEMTPLSGTNASNVDEQPNDGDTSYNVAASAPLTDTFAYPGSTVPSASIVYAVGLTMTVRKDDAGGNETNGVIRSGGTNYVHSQAADALTTSYQRFRRFWTTNPATGAAWSISAANAAEVGVKRTV